MFSWVNCLREKSGKQLIAIDGKTLRGAVNQYSKGNALHLVSAFETEQGLVLFQQATSTKESKLATVRDMLNMLHVRDPILNFDALHCNKETLLQIERKGDDYIV